MADADYRKINDGSQNSSSYHKKDGTNVRARLKAEDARPEPTHEYLGDGVYLSDDGFQLWLAVNSHDNPVVALDHGVFEALVTRGRERFKRMAGPPAPHTVAQFADACRNLDHKGIYELFEGASDELRDAMYKYAPGECYEPARAALNAIGRDFGVPSLADY